MNVFEVMDRYGFTCGDPDSDCSKVRAAIAELMDAVEWHLRCMDEYPENPVPMNRDGGTTRELRAALAKVQP